MPDTCFSFWTNLLQHAIRNLKNALHLHEVLYSLSECFLFGFDPCERWLYYVLFNGPSLYLGEEIALTSFMLSFIVTFLVFF